MIACVDPRDLPVPVVGGGGAAAGGRAGGRGGAGGGGPQAAVRRARQRGNTVLLTTYNVTHVLLTQVGVNWVRYLPPAPPHALPSINMVAHCGSVGQCRQ